MDQGPFCLRADCRWLFNEQMICLPETDKNTFKVEIGIYVPLQGSAFICGCVLPTPVPGRGKESGGNRKVAGLCEMSWCLELQWNWHKPDSSAHPIHLDMHWERASGKCTTTWCPASGWYLLNHIEVLKSKPRRESSGMFPSKDGKAPQNPPPPPGQSEPWKGPQSCWRFAAASVDGCIVGTGVPPPMGNPPYYALRVLRFAHGLGVEEGIGAGHLRMTRVTLSSTLRDVC